METIESLREEKARLEKELQRVTSSIEEHTGHSEYEHEHSTEHLNSRASKSGYLFKWQDRYIGWGGTKWDLRFVRLQGGTLGYYKTHEDHAPRYLLTLKNCAIRDDGSKRNKRYRPQNSQQNVNITESTVGAYFHVFSVYQRPSGSSDSNAELDDENHIVPLLRFSTTSLAEKKQWMDLLVQACAYCDSDAFDEKAASSNAASLSNIGMNVNVHGFEQNQNQTKGTIPLLYFAPKPAKLLKKPSNMCLNPSSSSSHLKLNTDKNAAKSNSKKKSGYPPSKPMHRRTEASYLSNEAPMQNYRGLLNLGLIILVVSNFRILLSTMRQYGSVLTYGFLARGDGEEFSAMTWRDVIDMRFVASMTLLNVFVVGAYLIEKITSRELWNERVGIFLHVINTNTALFLPIFIVWNYIDSPLNGGVLLMTASILWMKLISYIHANADYRHFPERNNDIAQAFIQNTDIMDSTSTSYPKNITLGNIYYFWFAPTLTYQIVFPKLAKRDPQKIVSLVLRLFLCFVLLVFLVAQVVRPVLHDMIEELQDGNMRMLSVHIIAEYLLKLGIASCYIWLLVFYGFFHVLFNLLAQLLRFGDRVFYRDWWNSSNLSSYWRLWNLPVHYWLVRHLYFPCIRCGVSKSGAMFLVFFFSAVMHELLISIPFHMIRPYSFLGMMGQIPLVGLTKYFDKVRPGSSIGNFVFWLSFCFLGQPMACIMYTIDHWKLNSISGGMLENAQTCDPTSLLHNCGDEL